MYTHHASALAGVSQIRDLLPDLFNIYTDTANLLQSTPLGTSQVQF